jgi:hypothetical protein
MDILEALGFDQRGKIKGKFFSSELCTYMVIIGVIIQKSNDFFC